MLATYYCVFQHPAAAGSASPWTTSGANLSLAIDRDTPSRRRSWDRAALRLQPDPPSVDGFGAQTPASELMSKEERIKQAKALLARRSYGLTSR